MSAAHAAAHPRPAIVSLNASHAAGLLPATGAPVAISVRVRGAKRCVFYRQTSPGSTLHAFHSASCVHGRASATAPAVKNPTESVVRLTYAVQVVGAGGRSVRRAFSRREAGAAPPKPTASLSLSASSLTYQGGTVTLSYTSTGATTCSLATNPSLLSSQTESVPCTGSTPVTISTTLAALQWSISFTATGPTGSATSTQTLAEQAPPFQLSQNWAGYIVPSGAAVTEAAGNFAVPILACAATPNGGQSTWVGIGGASPSAGDLLQTGVRSDCENGVQIDHAGWWELAPELPEIDFATLTVAPGDQIEASVYLASDGVTWVTRLDDLTTGISGVMLSNDAYGTILDSNTSVWNTVEGGTSGLLYGGGSTAEWIEEDYESNGALVPLADFGTVGFTNLSTSIAGAALTPSEQTAIAQGTSLLAVPSAPVAGGDGFSVTYVGPGASSGTTRNATRTESAALRFGGLLPAPLDPARPVASRP